MSSPIFVVCTAAAALGLNTPQVAYATASATTAPRTTPQKSSTSKRSCFAPLKPTYEFLATTLQRWHIDFRDHFQGPHHKPLQRDALHIFIDEGRCLLSVGHPFSEAEGLKTTPFKWKGGSLPVWITPTRATSRLPDARVVNLTTPPFAATSTLGPVKRPFLFIPSMAHWRAQKGFNAHSRYLKIAQMLLLREFLTYPQWASVWERTASLGAHPARRAQQVSPESVAEGRTALSARLRKLLQTPTAPGQIESQVTDALKVLQESRAALAKDEKTSAYAALEAELITLQGLQRAFLYRVEERAFHLRLLPDNPGPAAQAPTADKRKPIRRRGYLSRSRLHLPLLKIHWDSSGPAEKIGFAFVLLLDKIKPRWKQRLFHWSQEEGLESQAPTLEQILTESI